jgi:AbiV family abortive infection protein
VDLRAVNAAARPELLAYAAAAADNGRSLLDDAELLSGAGRLARAYSLAVLALEELGKVAGVLALAVMPGDLRAQAPLRRTLEWHELKLVGGMLMTFVSFDPPGIAVKFAGMSPARAAQILKITETLAQDADRLKMRGLYVDMDRRGRIRQPSVITEAEVAGQLGRAGQVASLASLLRDPEMQAMLADPPAEAIELSRALARALDEAGHIRGPRAAADVLLTAVTEFQKHMAASEAAAKSALSCPPDHEHQWPARHDREDDR